MSDARRNEARRRRSERQRAILAEASQLLKQVRKGQLHRDRLCLLADVGHPAAVEALGDRAPEDLPDLKRWVKRLDAYGHQVSTRIIAAMGRLLLPLLESDGIALDESRAAVEAGEAWIACPCDDCARLCLRAHTAAIAAAVHTKSDGQETAALIASFAAFAPTTPTPAVDIAADAADVASEDDARRAIRDALVPWALGHTA